MTDFSLPARIAKTVVITAPIALYHQTDVDFLKAVLARSDRVFLVFDGNERSRSSHLFPLTVLERELAVKILFGEELGTGRLKTIWTSFNFYEQKKSAELLKIRITRQIAVLGGQCDLDDIIALAPRACDHAITSAMLPSYPLLKLDTEDLSLKTPTLFDDVEKHLPPALKNWLEYLFDRADFQRIAAEHQNALGYKARWASSPFPPVFLCADILVRAKGQVLLIRRGKHPGRSLLAMPGGHLEELETLLACALREGSEETGIPEELLIRYLTGSFTADDPSRDPRGHYVTCVFLFDLPDEPPKVEGKDDADEAFFEDHKKFPSADFALDHLLLIEKLNNLFPLPAAARALSDA